jgi:hypothetical protein
VGNWQILLVEDVAEWFDDRYDAHLAELETRNYQ